MGFIFNDPKFIIGTNDIPSPIQMFKSFVIGGAVNEPTWQDVVLSGVGALTLVNAKADGLNYVKLFGGGENKIMLPAGYTQYTYIRNGVGATINTDWRPTVDDFVLDIRFYCNSTGSMYLWQSRDGASGTILGLGGSQSGSTISLYGGDGSPITSSISRTVGNIYHVVATLKNGNATLYVKDETAGVEDTQTGTYTFGVNATRFYFFGNANQYVTNGYRIYSAKCWYQGRLIQNWTAAQDSNDNKGIYNLVDGTFITNSNTWVMGDEVNNPSPDYPMDIVCNNGILKVRNKNIPSEYEEVNGLKGDGAAYINLNTGLTQDDEIEIKFSISSATAKEGVFGYRTNASTNNIAVAFANNNNSEVVSDFNNSNYATYRLQQSITPNIIYTLKINKSKRAIYNGDTLVAQNATVCNDTITVSNCFLFTIAGYPAYLERFTGTIYSCKIKNKRNLIPCRRNSDNVLGMYDTISETFLTNAGTGNFVAGANVITDYELYVDGITETVNIHNKNIWSNSKTSVSGVGYTITETDYGFIATAGASTGNSSRAVIYLDVDFFKENTTYVISGIDGYKSVYVGRTVDGANDNGYYKNGGSGRYFTISDIAEGQTKFTISIYLGAKDKGFEFDFSQIQIEEGSTSTEYETPFNGGTATAEMLLKVGAYQDVQSVLDGEVTRKAGILVLDGTEDWTTSTWKTTGNYAYLYRIAGGLVIDTSQVATVDCITSHAQAVNRETATVYGNNNIAYYGGGSVMQAQAPYILFRTSMNLTAWKQFLAQQYNLGTPVIVVYPLATSTIETVEGQTLTTQQGTNIIEITQASIDGLGLEVSYKAGVTVTVEEIGNANLDNSVTVTIGE